jgi:homoserine dehydrogenase
LINRGFILKLRLILVGFGVVGQSFVKMLINNYVELVTIHGLRPRIVAIVDSKGATIDKKGLNTKRVLKIKKNEGTVAEDPQNGFPNLTPREVINNIEADILIEMTPTNLKTGKPGFTHIEEGLKNKKHVITTNKGPLALALPALMELAEYNNVNLRFSGTVGGGTPILNFGKRCLMGDKILSIKGILNGTTNYILTEMTKKRLQFDIALRKAQKLGYAEKNPFLDINGLDAASKIVIISNYIKGC